MATVPGMDFDPKERAFDMDELRPQPIIKKRPKLFVQDENKVRTVTCGGALVLQRMLSRMIDTGTRERKIMSRLEGRGRQGD